MTICLSKDEIREITRKVKPSAQAKVLRHVGIECSIRPDGSVLVLTEAVRRKFKEKIDKQERPRMGTVK